MSPRNIAELVFICVIWGAGFCAMKVGTRFVPPFYYVGLRFALTALTLAVYMRARRIPFHVPREHRAAVAALITFFFAQQSLIFWATDYTRAGRIAVILNSQPALTAVLAHFFIAGDRLSPLKIAALALAIAGVHALFQEGLTFHPRLVIGDAMVLCAALGWAVSNIITKRLARSVSPISLVFWESLIGSPCFFAVALVMHRGQPVRIGNPLFLLCLAYLAFVATAYSFVRWVRLLQRHDPSTVTSFCFITPLAGVLFGWALLHEPITGKIGPAALAVGAGIVLANWPRRRAGGAVEV